MKPYPIITTLLTLAGLAGLFSLRIVGFYSHQALAVVLLLGLRCESRLAREETAPVPGTAP